MSRFSLLELLMRRDGFVIEHREDDYYAVCLSPKCLKERKAGRIWFGTLRIERRQMGGTGHCEKCGFSITALDYLMVSPRDLIGEQEALRLIGSQKSERYRYIARTTPIFSFASSRSPSAQQVFPKNPAPSP